MNPLLAWAPGPQEVVVLLIIVVLLFGAKKIPELARSLGRASMEYKKAKEDFLAEANKPAEDIKDAIASDPSAPSASGGAKDDRTSGSAKS